MSQKEVVRVPGVSEFLEQNKVPISPAIKANGFVFVSGAPPADPDKGGFVKGGIEAQTKACLESVKRTLECAGSSLEKVCMVRIYCANSAYFGTINEIYKTYFPKDPPARTFVTVASWPMEFDLEIECTALA
jgi:2-iminobutanoate/2-iminopropanoate deaminase